MAGERLRGRYSLAVGIALLGLVPNVVLSTAFLPLQDVLTRALGGSTTGVSLALGLSGAAYAVGAVLAAQLALRIVQRRIFLVAEAVFVVASALAALAPDVPLFLVGHVLQGLGAGSMLITSLPPLVTRFGAARVPVSAAIVNVGLFGASTLGPIAGGLVAAGDGWRWLLGACAVLGALGWVIALLGYDVWEPVEPEAPIDRPALVLVVLSTTAIFVGTSLVAGRPLSSWEVLLPLVAGLATLVALLAVESRQNDSLVPVGALATQLPVTGMLAAMVGGAVFVTVLELLETRLTEVAGRAPTDLAAACWPMPVGAAVGAVVFWRLFRTRWVPVLVDVGLVALAGAAALPLGGSGAPVVAMLLLGFGAAATVSPGLFLTGFGLASTDLARAFALVQLLRSVATYAVAPVAVALATAASSVGGAIDTGLLVMAIVAAAGLAAALAIPALSGARLRVPDLEAWLDGDPALPSPTTATHARPSVADEAAEPLLPGGRGRHRAQ
ncbi:MFS transporter [Nocardioides sp. DS6]|uniref:MFS transporter n=1 Tax=Nocardioides eburneus TaxID=3231482 RepID=A0ABV3SZ10_9ACTN